MKPSQHKLQMLMDQANSTIDGIPWLPCRITGLAVRANGTIIESRIEFDDGEALHNSTAAALANPVTLAEAAARGFFLGRCADIANKVFDEDEDPYVVPYRQFDEDRHVVEAVGTLAAAPDQTPHDTPRGPPKDPFVN